MAMQRFDANKTRWLWIGVPVLALIFGGLFLFSMLGGMNAERTAEPANTKAATTGSGPVPPGTPVDRGTGTNPPAAQQPTTAPAR